MSKRANTAAAVIVVMIVLILLLLTLFYLPTTGKTSTTFTTTETTTITSTICNLSCSVSTTTSSTIITTTSILSSASSTSTSSVPSCNPNCPLALNGWATGGSTFDIGIAMQNNSPNTISAGIIHFFNSSFVLCDGFCSNQNITCQSGQYCSSFGLYPTFPLNPGQYNSRSWGIDVTGYGCGVSSYYAQIFDITGKIALSTIFHYAANFACNGGPNQPSH